MYFNPLVVPVLALRLGFDSALLERLLVTNWLRTVGWSARALLALWMLLDSR